MGSLMAGWDAPIMDEDTARDRRNKSLTKEEIKSFWRSKSQNERGMNFSPYGSPVDSPQFLNDNEIRRRTATPLSRSQTDVWSFLHPHSVPNSPRTCESTDENEMTRKSDMTRDWWTRSNSAFLNEPPRDEMHGMAANYTAQFNVAHLTTTGNA